MEILKNVPLAFFFLVNSVLTKLQDNPKLITAILFIKYLNFFEFMYFKIMNLWIKSE